MQSSSLIQENLQEGKGFEPGATINNHFSLLDLSPNHSATSSLTASLTTEDPSQVITNLPFSPPPSDPCKICGNHMKRASCGQPIDNSKSKKPFTSPLTTTNSPAAATTTTTYSHLQGFNVLALPSDPTATAPTPTLRRCSSAPIDPPLINNAVLPASAHSQENLPGKSPSPGTCSGLGSRSRSSTVPEPLLRSISDPTPFLSYGPTPPPPPQNTGSVVAPRNSLSFSGGAVGSGLTGDESPASQRLRRMSDRMKEMKQWLDEVMRENEQHPHFEPNISTENCGCDTGKLDEKGTGEAEEEEEEEAADSTVSAERKGDSIILHFKCHCGSGYHILLSGKNCYYKLL
ncbi:hypothetical protein Ancab_039929 [Ancistrocladus abbreviatus]